VIDPVQSIRIAAALAERFGAIISQGNAAYGEAAVAELELRIGEAQQMYPEIWRHLDDACGALAARGADLSAYDALRRADLIELGVTDVEASENVDFGALRHGRLQNRQAKAAAFNVAGHKRAVAACEALMATMPEIDWKALARAENAEIAKAGSLRGRSNIVWFAGAAGVVVLGIAAIFALGGHDETARERADREAAEQGRIDLDRLDREIAADEAAHAHDRPSCGQNTRGYLEHKIVERYDLVRDVDWVSACAGGRFSIDGKVQNALVIAVTGRAKGELVTLRGFADPETYKPISMARYPVQIDAVEVRDLDGDGADEVVWKTARGTVTSTVRDGVFIDRK
jgi:hypothetical protein